jgi:DNA (cytosine-5)-methyltransferase 1
MKLTHLDLFSGIGGFSFGLEATGGVMTVAFCEINAFCRKVLRMHWKNVPIYEDVRTMDHDGPVDIITSGDPCQRDSRANSSRDGETMWPWTRKQIRKHRPLFVLRENVLGNIDTGTLERVESDLREDGYTPRTYDIPAAAIGAAHDRPRTWTLAHSDSARLKKFHYAAQPGTPEGWKHSLHVGPHGLYWVGTESPVLRRIDDVPHRVDAIRSLGNAVDPAIPYIFGKAILQWVSA